MKYTPFPFQLLCIEKGLAVLLDKKGRREVLVAPVGAGKAIIIAELASRLPMDGNILVVQPNKELLEQNLEKIESLGIKPAVYSASLKRKELGRVVYATPGSLNESVMSKANFKWVIVDECDAGSKPGTQFSSLLKKFKINSVLGLTASPIYLTNTLNDGSVLKIMTRVKGAFYKDICHVTQVSDVKELGRWSELKYKTYEFDRKGLVMNSSGSDYTEDSVKLNYVEANTDDKIIGVLNGISKEESVLIFVPGIENVEALSRKIKGSRFIHAGTKDSDRDEVVRKFKSGEIKVVVNASVMSVGFDYPNLRHIIDAYPTNSARIYYQKYGRLVRVDSRKPFGTVHDLAGNFEKFGPIEEFNFEYIPGYGWGMFKGDILITGVPMRENLGITKKMLFENKGVVKDTKGFYDFKKDTSTLTDTVKIPFGKHRGKSFKIVYETDKNYLIWLNNKRKEGSFDFSRCRDLEDELKKHFL